MSFILYVETIVLKNRYGRQVNSIRVHGYLLCQSNRLTDEFNRKIKSLERLLNLRQMST